MKRTRSVSFFVAVAVGGALVSGACGDTTAPPLEVRDATIVDPPAPIDGALPSPTSDAAITPPNDASVADAADGGPIENRNMGNSVGCGRAVGANGRGLQDRTITVNGKARPYLRFIPQSYDPNVPLSVVVVLHGSGGTKERAREFGFEPEANGQAIFIYPEALPQPPEQENRWQTENGSEDYALFDALVAETETTHCVDKDRLFVAGFSLGARFTSMLGCFRGNKIRAIAPGAPGMNAASLPLAKGPCVGEVAVWEVLGIADVDHKEGAELVRDHYRTVNGCSATRVATRPNGCEAYQGCRPEVPTTWCTHAGGHMWPAYAPNAVMTFFRQFN